MAIDYTQTVAQILTEREEQDYSPADFAYDECGFVDTVDLYRCHYEGGETVVYFTAQCSEGLDFHRGQYPELFGPSTHEDDEPGLSEEAYAAAVKIFWDRYDAEVYDESDGYLRFTVSITVTDENRTLEDVNGELDRKIVQLVNELDPGTFNCEYTFGIIARELKK